MWVMGAGAALVDTLPDHEVLQGAAQLLRYASPLPDDMVGIGAGASIHVLCSS